MAEEIRIEADHELQIVRMYIRGDLTIADHNDIKERVDAAALEIGSPDRVYVLQDGRDAGKVDADTRRAMRHDLEGPRQGGTAIYGVPFAQRLFMNALFRASGFTTIRFFDAEEKAVEWLLARKSTGIPEQLKA